MKKVLIIFAMVFGLLTNANAQNGINVGVSLTAGVFEVEGASEKFSGTHASDAASTEVVKKSSSENEEAEGVFALGSIFVEKTLGDRLMLGIDYVPHSLESESTENIQNTHTVATGEDAQSSNKVQVDFEDLVTVYASVMLNDNFYAKAGYVQVDVITNESLATGGSYGNTDLDGYTVALGYNRNVDNGMFVRAEANYIDMDGVTLTNSSDSTKSVTADGITGYGARISVGKSF
jgi:hypothetical protein